MESKELKQVLNGGEFLVNEADPQYMFIMDDMTEEQNMVLNMVREYIDKEVLPHAAQIEKLDTELTKQLLRKAGELGILGTSFPEEYGGFMQDFETNMAITEYFSKSRSCSLSYGAHTGIGMLPIL